jgi:hypothetical protein
VPDWFQQWKFILVIAMLGVSAFMVSDKNKLPLALRGLKKILDSQNEKKNKESSNPSQAVSPMRRLLAFLLVMLALILAVI